MILVAGESLIDLIIDPQGNSHASLGGGPYNAARTIARLGQPTRFLGRFSADPFGQLLTRKLSADQVDLALPDPVAEPTALAIVALSGAGIPRYWFHLAGTASFMLDEPAADLAAQADVMAVHIGSLGLVVEPMAARLERMVHSLPPSVLLLLDPNWRAQAVPDAEAQRARIRRIVPRTDILKLSTDDLAFLVPGRGVPEAARTFLGWGARCVLVTDGPRPVRAFASDAQLAVPVPPVDVVDTVGAGDALGGAFLAWWTEHRLARESLADPARLLAALTAAAEVAALTCGKVGADPPWRHELGAAAGWPPSLAAGPAPRPGRGTAALLAHCHADRPARPPMAAPAETGRRPRAARASARKGRLPRGCSQADRGLCRTASAAHARRSAACGRNRGRAETIFPANCCLT